MYLGDRKAKNLSFLDQFLAMAHIQLICREPLRDICGTNLDSVSQRLVLL